MGEAGDALGGGIIGKDVGHCQSSGLAGGFAGAYHITTND